MGIHLLDAVPPRIGPGIDEEKGDVENFVPLSGRLSPDGGRRVSRRVIAADYMDFTN